MLKIELTDDQYQERYKKPLDHFQACIVEAVLQNDIFSLGKLATDIRQITDDLKRWSE